MFSEAAKEVIYLEIFLREINYLLQVENPTIYYFGYQGIQKLMRSSIYHLRAKHIDIPYYILREELENREIDVQYVPT